MPDLPDEAGRQRIRIIYSRLESGWNGLEGMDGETIEGALALFKTTLLELSDLTGEDFNVFMPHTWEDEDTNTTCHTKDLRVQISTLMGELRPVYASEQFPHYVKASEASVMTVTQNVSQEVSITNKIIVETAFKLDQLESEYEEDTPERSFISKMKDGLQNVKDYASLISLAMTSGQAAGLDIEKLHHMLHALGLG